MVNIEFFRDCWQCNHHHSALDIPQKANPFPLSLSPYFSFSFFLLPSFSIVSPFSFFLYSLFNFSFSILVSLSPFLAQFVSVLSCFLFLLFSIFPLLSTFSSFPISVLSFPSFLFSLFFSLLSPFSILSLLYFHLSFLFSISSPFLIISFPLSNLFLIISFLFSSFFAVCSLFILVFAFSILILFFVFLLSSEDFHADSLKKFWLRGLVRQPAFLIIDNHYESIQTWVNVLTIVVGRWSMVLLSNKLAFLKPIKMVTKTILCNIIVWSGFYHLKNVKHVNPPVTEQWAGGYKCNAYWSLPPPPLPPHPLHSPFNVRLL